MTPARAFIAVALAFGMSACSTSKQGGSTPKASTRPTEVQEYTLVREYRPGRFLIMGTVECGPPRKEEDIPAAFEGSSPDTMLITYRTTLDLRFASPDAQGRQRFSGNIVQLLLQIRSEEGMTVTLDTGGPNDPLMEKIQPVTSKWLRRVARVRISGVIGPDGTLEELRGPGVCWDQICREDPSAASKCIKLRRMYGDSLIKEALGAGWAFLPPKRVAVGDTWACRLDGAISSTGSPMIMSGISRLESVERSSRGRVAEITFAGSIRVDGPVEDIRLGDMNVRADMPHGHTEARMLLNIDSGAIEDVTIWSKGQVDGIVEDQGRTSPVTETAVTKFQIIFIPVE